MSEVRANRLLALLKAAGEKPEPSKVLAARMNIQRPSLNAAIALLRRQRADIRIETVPGAGYRLAPETPPPAAPPSPVVATGTFGAPLAVPAGVKPPVRRLTARARLAAERLITEAGGFVPGRDLALAAGVPFERLQNVMADVRAGWPALDVVAKRGSGFRAAALGAPAEAPEPTRPAPPRPALKVADNERWRAGLAVLDTMPPALAATVKAIASESGEAVVDTVFRLLSYGVEVHHDLVVAEGQNPLQLRRAA